MFPCLCARKQSEAENATATAAVRSIEGTGSGRCETELVLECSYETVSHVYGCRRGRRRRCGLRPSRGCRRICKWRSSCPPVCSARSLYAHKKVQLSRAT